MRQWTNLIRTIAPTEHPVSLAQAKAHLRVNHADDDDYIEGLIATAVAHIEGPTGTGIALLTQTWRQSFTGVAGPTEGITLPLGPIQAITAVAHLDEDGQIASLPLDRIAFDPDTVPGRVYPASGRSWPTLTRQPGAIRVTYRVGYGDDPEDVPADLRHAILLIVGQLYEHREAASEADLTDIPFGVESVLARYRVGFFG